MEMFDGKENPRGKNRWNKKSGEKKYRVKSKMNVESANDHQSKPG